MAAHILSNRISRKMEYEKSREEAMGMAGTCGIFITATAAATMANVTFVAAAARGGEAAAAATAAAGNKANVSCKYFIATM